MGMKIANAHSVGRKLSWSTAFAMAASANEMMTLASMNHQNSLREARPLKVAYFLQNRVKASTNGHP